MPFDLLVVIALYLAFIIPSAALATLPPLWLVFAWFLLPSTYLIKRRKKNMGKIALAAFLIGLLAFSLDIILLHNHAWTPYKSDFSSRVFGVPPEEILWFFLHVFYILVFYEHFIDDNDIGRLPRARRIKPLAWFSAGVFAAVIVAIYVFPAASRIHYPYAFISGLGMIPFLGYFLSRRPKFIKKLLPLAVFFFLFTFIMEVRAVQSGLWAFRDTANYLALVRLFGIAFPVEEIVFWMLLAPSVAVAYYEFFIDDTR